MTVLRHKGKPLLIDPCMPPDWGPIGFKARRPVKEGEVPQLPVAARCDEEAAYYYAPGRPKE